MTQRILLVTTSLNGQQGQSIALANHLSMRVAERDELSLTQRDLAADPIPHLELDEFASWRVEPEQRTAQQRELTQRSDQLIEELQAHDVLVLAVPMYNFGVPTQLKAWFDRIMRAGVTFRYTENGPEGLVKGKRAVLLFARGGQYAGTEMDNQTPHIKLMLSMIGIEDISVVFAEGLNLGEARRDAALKEACQGIDSLVAEL